MSDFVPSGRQFSLRAGDQRAVVVEVGGGLRRYAAGGRDVVAGWAADQLQPHSAGAILAPWPNRIRAGHYRHDGADQQLPLSEPDRGNAIHGLLRWVRWSPVELTDSAVELSGALVPQTGYPWPLTVSVRWSLGPDGLRADHSATNPGPRPVPFGLGVHPYLHLAGTGLSEAWLQVPAATRLRTDEANIPVGRESVAGGPYDLRAGRTLGDLRLDTAFTDLDRDAAGRASVRLQGTEGGAEVWQDPAFGFVQAYTAAGFAGDTDAVAVEPMTGAPDAFNSGDGLVVLQPGQTWTGSWGIRPL